MRQILLLSDTHSFLHPRIEEYAQHCDEIWHAGDIGHISLLHALQAFNKPIRAVFGNIDGPEIRHLFPEDLIFELEGLKVFITHIGGYPSKYPKKLQAKLNIINPGLFICGHSHILRVMPDNDRNFLHINPGAAGNEGFHSMRTIVLFGIEAGRLHHLKVVELGRRGRD